MKYFSVVLAFLLVSCVEQDEISSMKDTDSMGDTTASFPSVNDQFAKYLDNFPKRNLPINIKACAMTSHDGLTQFNDDLYSAYSDKYDIAYAQIPTNGTYIATLSLTAADCYLPIITTYKLNGDIIDKKGIGIGHCGSDCGFSCEEFMTLKEDFTFYTSDTISVYTCDSLGKEIPNTYEHYVVYRQGKLLSDGNIQIGKEVRQTLQGSREAAVNASTSPLNSARVYTLRGM